MTLNDAVLTRHTVKAFEPGNTLPQADIDTLLNVLQNSPSSVNSQPWHFVVASTDEGRAAIAQATTGAFIYNEPKVLNASHVIALCMKSDITEAHLQRKMAALPVPTPKPVRTRAAGVTSICTAMNCAMCRSGWKSRFILR